MSTSTLASALAAARRGALPPAIQPGPTGFQARSAASDRPLPGQAEAKLSNADALMIALQRSARTVDDIVARRMLLASGCPGRRQA